MSAYALIFSRGREAHYRVFLDRSSLGSPFGALLPSPPAALFLSRLCSQRMCTTG